MKTFNLFLMMLIWSLSKVLAQSVTIFIADTIVCSGRSVNVKYSIASGNNLPVYTTIILNGVALQKGVSASDTGLYLLTPTALQNEIWVECTFDDSTKVTSSKQTVHCIIPVARPFLPKLFFRCDELFVADDSSKVFSSIFPDSIISKKFSFHDTTNPPFGEAMLCKLRIETYYGCADSSAIVFYVRKPRPKFRLITDSAGCVPFKVKLINLADIEDQINNSDTPTAETVFYVFGATVSPVSSRHRGDTITFTFDSFGKYAISARGKSSPSPSQGLCPDVHYPSSAADGIYVYALARSSEAISGPSFVPVNTEETYSTTYSSYHQYYWYASEGQILDGQLTNSVKVKWLGHGPKKIGVAMRNTIRQDIECGGDTLFKQVQVGATGLVSANETKQVYLQPNPVTHELQLNVSDWQHDASVFVTITNVQGQIVYQQNRNGYANTNDFSWSIPVSSLSPGIYTLVLQHRDETIRKKFIKL